MFLMIYQHDFVQKNIFHKSVTYVIRLCISGLNLGVFVKNVGFCGKSGEIHLTPEEIGS